MRDAYFRSHPLTADNREIRTLASEETRILVKVLALTWRLRPLGQVALWWSGLGMEYLDLEKPVKKILSFTDTCVDILT